MSLKQQVQEIITRTNDSDPEGEFKTKEIFKIFEKRLDILIEECENEQKEIDKYVYISDWDIRMAEKKRGACSAQIGAYIKFKNILEFW